MKHFLNVQNGHVFALFLCIFTNFFLILLIKKGFLRILLCIFPNRQKKCRQPSRHCGQHASRGMHATCEQHTQTSISAGKRKVFIQLSTSSHLDSLQNPTSSGRQVNSSRHQPENISPRHSVFLTEQIAASRSSATFIFTNLFHPPTYFLFSRNLPQKKLSRRLSFSRCI